MTKIKDIAGYLESLAPLALQENYDNAGLLCGDPEEDTTGILVTLDVTEKVVAEAQEKGCNLIVAHHPVIFKGLKGLTGKNYVERTVINAIRGGTAIYAIHTNLDNVNNGVNQKLCDVLGIKNTRPLAAKNATLKKLITFVPEDYVEKVMEALHAAGAGNIGNYSHCSFRGQGTGTYMPNENADPFAGERGKLEMADEVRVEVIFPFYYEGQIISSLLDAHPYEEVAYYIQSVDNKNNEIGSGMIGKLVTDTECLAFLKHVKAKLNVPVIRHTAQTKKMIRKIAVCGGSGSFLLPHAIRAGADVFISSDFKYHEFFDADGHLMVVDVGHYESEFFTKELLHDFLTKKFTTFAVNLSETVTNPISYL